DCFVIDYVALHPKCRGHKLGLLAVRKTIDRFAVGCGLTACYIRPLQPNARDADGIPRSWIPLHETAKESRAAFRKLEGYFGQMGFTRIPRTSLYGLSMVEATPSLQQLLGEEDEPGTPEAAPHEA